MTNQLNNIEKKVLEWNSKFPIDKWWRDKHGVAFMSEQHKSCSFLDQIYEFTEDLMTLKVKHQSDKYIPNIGDFLASEQEFDDTNVETRIKSMKEEFEGDFPELFNGQDS